MSEKIKVWSLDEKCWKGTKKDKMMFGKDILIV